MQSDSSTCTVSVGHQSFAMCVLMMNFQGGSSVEYITPEHYELAAENGISAKTVYQRVYQGWSINRAITTPVMPKKPFRSKYAKLAVQNGINFETFRRRVCYSGWDEYTAATTPPIPIEERSGFKLGSKSTKFTKEQKELLARNGISISLARQRINRMGWRTEDALTIPPYQTRKKVMG